MSEPDPKMTLREFKEYVDLSYEGPPEIAGRLGVAQRTIWVFGFGSPAKANRKPSH